MILTVVGASTNQPVDHEFSLRRETLDQGEGKPRNTLHCIIITFYILKDIIPWSKIVTLVLSGSIFGFHNFLVYKFIYFLRAEGLYIHD
jgi:hypothetical protein